MTSTPISRSATRDSARSELCAFLRALAGPALAGGLFEVRERHGQLMRRRFYPVEYPDRAVSAILRAGRERDVYLGAAIRAHAHGGRAAIPWLSSLWVDADIPDSIDRLTAFTPAPSILVASGRGRHAYWLLDRPVDLDTGEDANRRLVHALAADPSCHDAARILRPPHTHNHCYQPPEPVTLLRLQPDCRRSLQSIITGLSASARARSDQPGRQRVQRPGGDDPLLALDPAYYVSALLDVQIGRDRKVSCPFHTDEHPSLHVYPTAAQGWHCFSCRRGGTVYDLAAPLWLSGQSAGGGGQALRGREFIEVRERLMAMFFGRDVACARRESRGVGLGD